MKSIPTTHDHHDGDTARNTFRAWLAVVSLAIGSFATVTAEFLPVGLLPEIARSFGISSGSAGLMMTLPGVLAALSAPGIMLVAGRSDRKRIVLLLSAILLVSCLLSAFATSFAILLIGRALVGVSLGAFWAMALAVAVRLVPAPKSQKASAAVFAGVTAAMILGVPLGNLVAAHYSWRGAFLAAGGIATLAMLLQAFSLPSVPAQGRFQFAALLNAARPSATKLSMLMIALMFAAHFGAYTYVAPLLQQASISAADITLLLFAYGLAGFVSNFVASHFLAKRMKATLLSAKLLLLVPLLCMPLMVSSAPTEMVLLVIWGMAWGALPVCLNAWNRAASEADGESTAAVFTFTCQTAIALGSGAGGFVVDHSGLATTFWLASAAVALSAMLLWRARRS
ncbi:MFS transporter [Xanthomonas citri]|uniref:MFS transporter n=1 Tax=Xanthomonas citri TaxID=346 RepID=UPI000687F698|nr:MFS transporter [Xanthomonas citri]QTK40620.1 MFS transporter [Xanthomonas citri pv. glycines]